MKCIGRLLIHPGWNVYPLQISHLSSLAASLVVRNSIRRGRGRGGGEEGGEKGIVRTKCLVQEHNTMTQPGVEPRPL